MKLCLSCKRLWPHQTVYCGTCGGTLGTRICANGHTNNLVATACTTCGNRKLSRGVACLNLGVVSLACSLLGAWLLVRYILFPLGWLLFAKVASFVLPVLVTLIFWTFIASIFVNERGRAMIASFWSGLIHLTFQILGALVRAVAPRKPHPRAKSTPKEEEQTRHGRH